MQRMPFGADLNAAFVVRVPHSIMSYEDNLKRLRQKFWQHSPVQYNQIYLDGQPIGPPMMTQKANEICAWLAWSLQDLEKLFRTASRGAGRSRKPKHHGRF